VTSSYTRYSACRRRALRAVPFQQFPNLLKKINFQFTWNLPLYPFGIPLHSQTPLMIKEVVGNILHPSGSAFAPAGQPGLPVIV
jgi:hypothetical protein